MKAKLIGEPQIIMSNPYNRFHRYFGWPSVAKLQNGKIAVVSSAFRNTHVCPFGKAVISYSENNGETYSLPAPVIDTVLDDRDAGIVTFGESGVIVTSFNNHPDRQRICAGESRYRHGYLDMITEADVEKCLGSTFRISHDCGVTFGELYKSPVTSPHGPCVLKDGTILWVGCEFPEGRIQAYTLNPDDGAMIFVGEIPGRDDCSFCEPHAIELDDGRILCHIRSEGGEYEMTMFQSISSDGGKTWSEPVKLMDERDGAPAHILKHSSGVLICAYGYRSNPDPELAKPYSIRVMFSSDNAKTWDTGHILYESTESRGGWGDIGYPASIELDDGSILTVFYARPTPGTAPVVMQQKWRITE